MKTGVTYVVLVGSIADGYNATGPFNSYDEALGFAITFDVWDIIPVFPVVTEAE